MSKSYFSVQLALTDEEGRSQFSLWSMMASPLIAGNDLTSMSTATRETLTNAEVIAVNQDPLVAQGRPVKKSGDVEVWSKPLQGQGVRAVALFNRRSTATNIAVSWADIGLADTPAMVRDLWAHADRGAHPNGFSANVPAHGVVVLKITAQPR